MFVKLQVRTLYLSLELEKPPDIDGLVNCQLQWGREIAENRCNRFEIRSGTAFEENPKSLVEIIESWSDA